jgi:DNA-binding response OmpR family regulator
LSRILLVDDEPNYRLTLTVLFEDEGFAVDGAGSYAEAIERMELTPSYDLVILDHNLGDGKGIDLIPTLRARMPLAKVMLVSGSTKLDEVVPGGIDSMVSKDFVFPELLAQVQSLLG